MGQLLPTAMAHEEHQCLKKTILVLSISSLQEYRHLGPSIEQATRNTESRLLIILVSPLFDPENGIDPIGSWKEMESFISFVYMRASTVAIALDRVLMSIDVVLHPGNGSLFSNIDGEHATRWEGVYVRENDITTLEALPKWISTIPQLRLRAEGSSPYPSSPSSWENSHRRHGVVALGGTFDHLHAGHKILLSMAAWITAKKIIVGVTDDTLLGKKSHREVLESIGARQDAVRAFLQLFRPQIEAEVVAISDVYGPTATDDDIQALVVSKETISGGQSIAKLRDERGLPSLETFVINVISDDGGGGLIGEEDAERLRTAKMSSTYIRRWIATQTAPRPTPTDA